MIDDPDTYLISVPGTFTSIDDVVKEKAREITHTAGPEGYLEGLRRYIASLSREPKHNYRRNASQIIQSGYRTGCIDRAHAFTALSRAGGIPTRFVFSMERELYDFQIDNDAFLQLEMLQDKYGALLVPHMERMYTTDKHKALYEAYQTVIALIEDFILSDEQFMSLAGFVVHAFADVHVDGEWRPYEPRRGFFPKNKDIIFGSWQFQRIAVGRDLGHVYMIDRDRSLDTNPSDLTQYHEILIERYMLP